MQKVVGRPNAASGLRFNLLLAGYTFADSSEAEVYAFWGGNAAVLDLVRRTRPEEASKNQTDS